MDSDNMEIGETGLVPTEYGFYNSITGEKLNHEGLPINEATPQED